VEVRYGKIEDLPVGADRLFKVMMRLEFALKEIGFCRTANSQSAEVDWDRFANDRLGSAFFDEVQASGEASVLVDFPPMRQTVSSEGYLNWEPAGAVSNVQELLGAVRRVRNNLFHGGKSGDPDSNRNVALVGDALRVVDSILQSDDDLRMMFEGNY
jgi:hypothetical protein